jgi:hypothetical protein
MHGDYSRINSRAVSEYIREKAEKEAKQKAEATARRERIKQEDAERSSAWAREKEEKLNTLIELGAFGAPKDVNKSDLHSFTFWVREESGNLKGVVFIGKKCVIFSCEANNDCYGTSRVTAGIDGVVVEILTVSELYVDDESVRDFEEENSRVE